MNFPKSETNGGWKFLKKNKNVNIKKINIEINRQQVFFGNYPNSIVIIKDGYVVHEHNSFMTLPQSRFDVWSCTKSFTGFAWFLLLDEIKNISKFKKIKIDLDTYVYSYYLNLLSKKT